MYLKREEAREDTPGRTPRPLHPNLEKLRTTRANSVPMVDSALSLSDPEEFASSNARRREQSKRAHFSKSSPDVSLYILALGRGSPKRYSTPQPRSLVHSDSDTNKLNHNEAQTPSPPATERVRSPIERTKSSPHERRSFPTPQALYQAQPQDDSPYNFMPAAKVVNDPLSAASDDQDVDETLLPPDSPIPDHNVRFRRSGSVNSIETPKSPTRVLMNSQAQLQTPDATASDGDPSFKKPSGLRHSTKATHADLATSSSSEDWRDEALSNSQETEPKRASIEQYASPDGHLGSSSDEDSSDEDCDAISYSSGYKYEQQQVKLSTSMKKSNRKTNNAGFACNHTQYCATCAEGLRGYPRDWNRAFQKKLHKKCNTEEERLKRFVALENLSKDFATTAKMYGKIIIAEAFLDRQYQTIKPCEVGGLAGGQKYIYHGIFFKFALDTGLYGGDENAMKAAGHDLKGLMRYSDIPGLSVPLIQLIDYRGFRLVAISILPIERGTIVYGSSDGGTTVHAKDEMLNNIMKVAAEKMNLKGHFGGWKDCQEKKFIYGPTDIEGHVGKDNRRYVLDFARVCPPTTPKPGKKNCYLYQLMRPEFLKINPVPLSSDAFSPFGSHDSKIHNQEIVDATSRLENMVIPSYATYLDKNLSYMKDLDKRLTEYIHRAGINVRYLGLLRHWAFTEEVKQLLLTEMVSRIVKIILNRALRQQSREHVKISDVAAKQVIVDVFNLVLGHPMEKAKMFWQLEMKAAIIEKFGERALSSEEAAPDYDLHAHLVLSKVLDRVGDMAGATLTKKAFAILLREEAKAQKRHDKAEKKRQQDIKEAFFNQGLKKQSEEFTKKRRKSSGGKKDASMLLAEDAAEAAQVEGYWKRPIFKVVSSDVAKMKVRSKNMNIIYLAKANSLALRARQERGSESDRLFLSAKKTFELAMRTTPDNSSIHNNYADACFHQALLKEKIYREKAKKEREKNDARLIQFIPLNKSKEKEPSTSPTNEAPLPSLSELAGTRLTQSGRASPSPASLRRSFLRSPSTPDLLDYRNGGSVPSSSTAPVVQPSDSARKTQEKRTKESREILQLFETAIEYFIHAKNFTMLEAARGLIKRRYVWNNIYSTWEEKQILFDVLEQIWDAIASASQSAREYYSWAVLLVNHTHFYPKQSNCKAALDLYRKAGEKFMEALALDKSILLLLWDSYEMESAGEPTEEELQVELQAGEMEKSATEPTSPPPRQPTPESISASGILPIDKSDGPSKDSPSLVRMKARTRPGSGGYLYQNSPPTSGEIYMASKSDLLSSSLMSSDQLFAVLNSLTQEEEEEARRNRNLKRSPVTEPIGRGWSSASKREQRVDSPRTKAEHERKKTPRHQPHNASFFYPLFDPEYNFGYPVKFELKPEDIACMMEVLHYLSSQESSENQEQEKSYGYARKRTPSGLSMDFSNICYFPTEHALMRLLHFYGNSISSIIFPSSNAVTDLVLEQASKCSNLCSLRLENCLQLTEKGLAAFRNMQNLHTLVINGCTNISDQVISGLSIYCPNVKTLLLENCSNLTDHSIRNIVGANARKVSPPVGGGIMANMSTTTTGGTPKSPLRKAIPEKQVLNKVAPVSNWLHAETTSGATGGIGLGAVLENLKLGNYGGATMLPNVIGLLSNCSCLRQLDLTKCAKLKDDNLIDALRGTAGGTNIPAPSQMRYNSLGTLGPGIGSSIRKLTLRECRDITDQSLLCIAANCPKLLSIDLYNCTAISDEGIKPFMKALGSTLRLIDLSRTGVDKGIVTIAKRCLFLRALKLEGCKAISDTSLTKFGSKKMQPILIRGHKYNTHEYEETHVEEDLPRTLNLREAQIIIPRTKPNTASVSPSSSPGKWSAGGIPKVYSNQLESLVLSGVPNLTDASLILICKKHSKLKKLVLAQCRTLSDSFLTGLSVYAPDLNELDIRLPTDIVGPESVEQNRDFPLRQPLNPLRTPQPAHERKVMFQAYNSSGMAAELSINVNSSGGSSALPPPVTSQITDVGITRWLANRDQNCLRRIVLMNCSLLTNVALKLIAKQCYPTLEELIITNNKHITDKAIRCLSIKCDKLARLGISECLSLTNDAIFSLSRWSCDSLVALDCKRLNVTDASIIRLANNCIKLERLEISECPQLTEEVFVALAGAPSLLVLKAKRIPAKKETIALLSENRSCDVEV